MVQQPTDTRGGDDGRELAPCRGVPGSDPGREDPGPLQDFTRPRIVGRVNSEGYISISAASCGKGGTTAALPGTFQCAGMCADAPSALASLVTYQRAAGCVLP